MLTELFENKKYPLAENIKTQLCESTEDDPIACGVYGCVYRQCLQGYCLKNNAVLKTYNKLPQLLHIFVNRIELFNSLLPDHSPRFHFAYRCGPQSFMVMSRAPGNEIALKEFLLPLAQSQLQSIFRTLRNANVAHADLHSANVLWDGQHVTLIDFDNSQKYPKKGELVKKIPQFAQMMRGSLIDRYGESTQLKIGDVTALAFFDEMVLNLTLSMQNWALYTQLYKSGNAQELLYTLLRHMLSLITEKNLDATHLQRLKEFWGTLV